MGFVLGESNQQVFFGDNYCCFSFREGVGIDTVSLWLLFFGSSVDGSHIFSGSKMYGNSDKFPEKNPRIF